MTAIPPLPTPDDCIPWGIDTTCCSTEFVTYSTATQNRAAAMAWKTLALLTGGRLGACAVTMRPCLSDQCDTCSMMWTGPMIVNGCWVNNVCGGSDCACTPLCEIVFPGPVADIVQIQLDGLLLDETMFRIDNGNRLVRHDGECWPSCQRLDRPLGLVCTLGITYLPGLRPDTSALYAAGVLACEFAKACTGGKCRLPAGATSVARQGVVIELTTGMWPGGMTGIREVDAVIAAVNPNGILIPPLVWSPDMQTQKHRFTTWVGV